MKKRASNRIFSSVWSFVAAALALPFAVSDVKANVIGNDTQNFVPTSGGIDFVTVHSSEPLRKGYVNFGLFVNHAINTLPYTEDKDGHLAKDRDNITALDFSIGYGLLPNLELGIGLPYLLHQKVKSDIGTHGEFSSIGITEVRGGLKLRLFGDQKGGMATIISMNRNMVRNNPYLGNGGRDSYNVELAGDTTVGSVALGANIGYRVRSPGEQFPLYEGYIEPVDDQYLASVAASYLLNSVNTKLILEVYGSRPVEVTSDRMRRSSTLEGLGGIKISATESLALHTGVASELLHGISSPDLRIYAGLNWSIGPKKEVLTRIKAPKVAEPPPPEPVEELPGPGDEVFVLRDVNFLFDSDHKVYSGVIEGLNKFLAHIKNKKIAKIIIEGHTDSMGSDEYNIDLSTRRAGMVKKYLEAVGKIDGNKLVVEGYGESKPVADNGNYQGRRLNRRVVFRIFYSEENGGI
jgi:outer membrane protein OmpA-like peptidoglycan-associated protein